MAIIVRLMVMILAYVFACLAASIVLTLGTLSPQWDELQLSAMPTVALWIVIVMGAVLIAAIAVLPALLVIALAEGFAWRSVIVYGVLGGVLGLALGYGLDFAGYLAEAGDVPGREPEVLAASGIAGGLVYWLFAGRNAGFWK